MSADFYPVYNETKELKPFRFWCQKVLPLVYDDTLSYYELLCKVVDYLNKTMEDVNTLSGDVEALHAAFHKLQDYVNEYFDDLDIQTEINDKLDQMADSGELSAIIAPIVLNVAVPLFVDSTDAMTDTSRIYVLTTTGYVYIWNGTAWYNTGMNYTDNFTQYVLVSGTLSSGTDANDILVNGVWNISNSNTYTHLPIHTGMFQCYSISGVIYQIAISNANADRQKTYFRSKTAIEGWSEWTVYDLKPNAMEMKGILASTDLDELVTTGIYTLTGANAYSNCPVSSGLLEVFQYGNYKMQRATYTDSANNYKNTYVRAFYTSSGWLPWVVYKSVPASYAHEYKPDEGMIHYSDHDIGVSGFESGYYDTSTGALTSGSTFVRSKVLFRVKQYRGYRLKDASLTNRVDLLFFDADYNYLDYTYLTNGAIIPKVAPLGAAFAGINYRLDGGSAPELLEIVEVDGSRIQSVTDTPVDGTEIYRVMSRVIYNNGTLSSHTDAYKCFFVPNPTCKKVLVFYNTDNNCYCIDKDGLNVTPASYEQMTPSGRLYTIPEGTVLIGINWRVDTGQTYIAFGYDADSFEDLATVAKGAPFSRLNGKKIAAIGDSLTYIDGRSYGGTSRLEGWQTYLRLLGATVQTFAYNGYAYAENLENNGIVKTIITNDVDFSGYDIAILFGGANDVRLSVTVGTPNTDYDAPETDTADFIGAIGALTEYLREENPNMEIFICTTLPSQDSTRTYAKSGTYNTAIKGCADFWQLPVIDLFTLVNVHPTTNFTDFFYDNTHPNAAGCKRIGKIIASYVDHYLSLVG